MPKFEKAIQSAGESLYGDESLRSNLTDSEAKVVLDWALSWITERVNMARDEAGAKQIVQNELARVRAAVSAINASAKKPGALKLAEVVAAMDTTLSGGKALAREEVFALVTLLTSTAWKMRVKK